MWVIDPESIDPERAILSRFSVEVGDGGSCWSPADDLIELAPIACTQELVLRSEEHTSELQSRGHLVCRLLLEKKNTNLLGSTVKIEAIVKGCNAGTGTLGYETA